MKIYSFKTLSGKCFKLELDDNTTVEVALKTLGEVGGINAQKSILIYRGMHLDPQTKISTLDYTDSEKQYIIIHTKIDHPALPLSFQNPPMIPIVPLIESTNKQHVKAEHSVQTTQKNMTQEEKMDELLKMGFNQKRCEDALDAAEGNLAIAIEILLGNNRTARRLRDFSQMVIPSPSQEDLVDVPPRPIPKHPKYHSISEIPGFSLGKNREQAKHMTKLRSHVLDQPDIVFRLIDRVLGEDQLHILESVRENRAPLLLSLGVVLIPEATAGGVGVVPFLDDVDEHFWDRLGVAASDVENIRKICQEGYDIALAINTYYETDLNVEKTLELLRNGSVLL